MNQPYIRLSWIFLASIAVAQAHEEGREHGAHAHGIARLDIAVENGTVQLDLASPASNLIGFEHAPVDSKESAILEQAVANLKQGNKLMAFTPAAQCTQKKVLVKSGLLDHAGEMDDDHDHDAEEEHHHEDEAEHEDNADEHADIMAFWEFSCAHAEALHEIDFKGLFQRFPGTRQLRIQAALPGGQTAVELTPAAAKLKM